ncbi:MAG TPA: sulfatase-like hydrolase/transferase [Verrucomicrobiae bacterium]|jgi:arylsulfatase A-like enzyme|nr:sulfatase-like hydrolase/transferase [Verrucomicrobiae bacterium]
MPRANNHPMTRRDLLRGAATGMIALAIGDIQGAHPRKPPNIVFILADDLGYADVACYGRPDLSTPNIDHIARRGMRFLQAYANSAVCTATRTALITGRYQYRLRLGLEEPLAGNPGVGLPPEHPTLPSLLKKAGYSSTLVGKWHLGVPPKFGPLQSGYDHFYGFRGGAVDYFSHTGGGAGKEDFWEDEVPIHRAGYLTDLLGSRAVDVVNGYARSDQPFMVSLHFNAPHWPWEAPGDEAESERLRQPGSGGLFDFDGGSQKTYQRMIEAMDAQIGRVLKALDAHGLTENTIVIFTSDNGGERFADTWPFTGKKTELLEGGLRIPAIISWPGRIRPGVTTDQVSISMDWVPTLLAAAGAQPDPAYPSDGMNLLPVLTQNAAPVSRKLFWRYKANAQRAARDGNYKFLKILDNTFLFNVVEDPLERANLKERQKDVYHRLVRDWYDWNSSMLPEIKESFTHSFTGQELADHFGAKAPDQKPDIPVPPDD